MSSTCASLNIRMRVRLVDQPARDLLGDELVALLRSPATSRFWAASAWVRRPALRRLEPDLKSFSGRVRSDECRGLFGVDLGGTTCEGIQLASRLFGQARVFHSGGQPPRTFHPKLYLFEQPGLAVVCVGSPNFTSGGLWANFEITARIELDLALSTDRAFLEETRSWFEHWWEDPNGSRPANAETIASLMADPAIRLPHEHEVRRILTPPASTTTRHASIPNVFPKPVAGLKPIPRPPANIEEAAELDEQPTVVLPGLALEELTTPSDERDLRVLLAGIPRERWPQVGFNRTVTENFFHLFSNGDVLWLQGVRQDRTVSDPREARLVYPSGANQNHRIEFPDPDGRRDPRPDRALLVLLERSFRTYTYMSLRAGDAGYPQMRSELEARPPYGVARKIDTKRVLMTYDDLTAAWPGTCPLRP
jgi:hypothetical protein